MSVSERALAPDFSFSRPSPVYLITVLSRTINLDFYLIKWEPIAQRTLFMSEVFALWPI